MHTFNFDGDLYRIEEYHNDDVVEQISLRNERKHSNKRHIYQKKSTAWFDFSTLESIIEAQNGEQYAKQR